MLLSLLSERKLYIIVYKTNHDGCCAKKNAKYRRSLNNCSYLSGESGRKGSMEDVAFGLDLEGDGLEQEGIV